MSREAIKELKKYCEGKSNTEKVEINVLNLNRIINAFERDQCGDCIRRSDIGLTDFEIVMCNGDYKEALKMLLDKIADAPSVTPMPKMGHWELDEHLDKIGMIYKYKCSECGANHSAMYDYCPSCGSYNGGDTNAGNN